MGTSRYARLLLLIVVSSLAWKTSHSMEKNNEGDRIVVPNLFCALPELLDRASTNSISLRAGHLVLGHREKCRNFPNGEHVSTEFRTADGTCNHPLNYGAAGRPPKRLLNNAYNDGLGTPRTRGIDGEELPPTTMVSRIIHTNNTDFQNLTVMVMQWGQFLDHDMTGSPITSEVNRSIRCCGENGEFPSSPLNSECFPIPLEGPDVNGRFRGKCLEFARSVAARDKSGKEIVPREQINAVTSFIDGSMIYGSEQELQDELRDRDSITGELLATMRMTKVGSQFLLPNNFEDDCTHDIGQFCFFAGDERVNEQPLLAAIHTMFVRLHNIIAKLLKAFLPKRSEEEIFQLTRKIVGAIVQKIHYEDWLPVIIGRKTMRRFGLLRTRFGTETYDPEVDARIANSFATAVFRFGHSLIPDSFHIDGKDIRVRDLFGEVAPLFNNINDVYQAMIEPMNGGAHTMDRFFTAEVSTHLFEPNASSMAPGSPSFGLDLVGLNMQRGRDHGLPPYNHFRKFCGLEPLTDFSNFSAPLDDLYRSVYNSTEDIDFFSGMMTETPKFGIVGETLACMLGTQFRDLKRGDRFFYETPQLPEGFTRRQLIRIRRITLAHIFCVVSDAERVQRNIFRVPSERNQHRNCSTLRGQFIVALKAFKVY